MSVDQDVPLLGLGREQSQAWKQLVVVVAQALQRRRVELGRSAWSAARAAERASEQYGRDLEPRVRAMAAADEAAFRSAAETGAVGFERRSSDGPQFGWMVHTVVGPMPEACPSGGRGAWGLHGHGVSGGTSLSVFVVVADRETAVRLRDEVTGGQQRTLRDLGRLGVYGHDRAEHARTEVRENECVLRARVERSLYAAWPHDGELVAAVMRAPYGEDNPDYTVIDQLAGQLRDLEDRGYRMVDVLSRLDPSAIGRWRAQGGAQGAQGGIDLAGHICDQVRNLSQRLQAPDGAPVGEHADVVGEPGRGSGVPRAGLDHGPAEQLLRRYVAPRTADAVIGCVAWPGLAKQVLAWQDQGIPIAAELAHLPEERIRHANFPAGYLKAVLRRSVDVRQNVDARQDTAGQDTAGQDTAGQNTVGETAAAEAARSGDRGGVDGLGETRRPGPVTDAGRDGVPESPFPIRDLDPTHAVEHAALEMSRGAGTVADDAYIEAVLTADDPGRTGLDLDGGPSQSESEVSTAQDERAVDPEVSQDPVSCAELERVVAQAEQESAPTAGALRAECAHRPPDATTQQPPPAAQPPAPPEPGPAPVRSPTRAPRRR